jgi:general secretion pathway protein C
MDWKQYKALGAEALLTGRSVSVATALCVVLLAYSAARLTWMVVPISADGAGAPPPLAAPVMAPHQADALSMSRDIVAKHLFGQVQTAGAQPGLATIPETRLKLVLRGVMASQDSHTATAIVADPSGHEDYYTVGKELPGGATLKEVHAQYIVLSRGGRLETLRLPTDSLKVSNGALASPATAASPGVAPDAGALLQQYREQFIKNPQSLANLLQGEPYWENGRLVGYRLRPGRDPGVLEKFGIQSGDVVTAINGVSLTDPGGRMELLRDMNNATQFNVDLIRGGRPFSISIPIGQPG